MVLAGLDVLLPLLTPELLAAATTAAGGGDGGGGGGGPGAGGKLARLLFSLLAYMMEVHTQAVSVQSAQTGQAHAGGVDVAGCVPAPVPRVQPSGAHARVGPLTGSI